MRRRIEFEFVKGRQELQGTSLHRQAVLLCLFVVESSLGFSFLFACLVVSSSSVQMADRAWKSKGDKVPRRSPRKRGNRCGRPFKAPRAVTTDKEEIHFQLRVTAIDDSDVQVLTDSAVQKIQNQTNTTDNRFHCRQWSSDCHGDWKRKKD